MKKIYTSFIAFSCISIVAMAKTSSIGIPGLYPYFNTTVAPSSPGGTSLSRIIAKSSSTWANGVLQPSDSNTYTYSMGRGGWLNDEYQDNFVNFETSNTYVYDITTGQYINKMYRFQDYHASGKPLTYTMQVWRPSTNNWRDSARFQYSYNNNFSRLETTMFQIWYGAMSTNHVIYNNIYDAANRVVEMNSTVYKMELSYDLGGNLSERKDQKWAQATGWDYSLKMNFTYDVSGHIAHYIEANWDGLNWINTSKYELSFSGNDMTTQTIYHWVNNTWQLAVKHTYTYDTQHNKLSDQLQVWDGASFMNATLFSWTYNSFNQPLTYESKTWNTPSNNWAYAKDDFSNHYYYQTYNPTGIFDKKAPIQLSAYPIPAHSVINLSIKQEKPLPLHISIHDTQGKLVQEEDIKNTSNGVQSISIEQLPTGQYFLKATTVDGIGALQFTVMK